MYESLKKARDFLFRTAAADPRMGSYSGPEDPDVRCGSAFIKRLADLDGQVCAVEPPRCRFDYRSSFYNAGKTGTGVKVSTVNPIEAAAIPTAIAVLQALQTFKNDLGADPLKFPLTVGPAFLKFTANVELQAPGLVNSEWSAISLTVDTKVGSLISSLQAKLSPPQAAPVPAAAAIPQAGH